MHIKSVFLAFSILLSQQLFSQEIFKRFSLGLGRVKNEYNGDYGNALFNLSQKAYYSTSAFLSFNISPSFDIGVEASSGNYGYYIDIESNFEGGKDDILFYLNYKLNNGYLLDLETPFSPYISLAIGNAKYYANNKATPWPTIISGNNDRLFSLGLGTNYKISRKFSLRYEFLYNFTDNDKHDENRTGGINKPIFGTPIFQHFKKGNDNYGQHFIYFVYQLTDPRDKDRDGILDKYQKKN